MEQKRVTSEFSFSPQIAAADMDAVVKAGFRSIVCNRPDSENTDQPRSRSGHSDQRTPERSRDCVPSLGGQRARHGSPAASLFPQPSERPRLPLAISSGERTRWVACCWTNIARREVSQLGIVDGHDQRRCCARRQISSLCLWFLSACLVHLMKCRL